jgi:hypothetical protein
MPYGSDELVAPAATGAASGTPSLNAAVSLCNSALILLGQERIESLTDGSETARICSVKWPEVRDAILRDPKAKWSCLKKRAELARLAAAPVFGFLYAYQLPPDCYQVLGLSVDTATWAVEGKAILTDEEQALISYLGYDTAADNVSLFDSLLTSAIISRLAAEMAPSLKSADRAPALWEAYERKLAEARLAGVLESSKATASCTAFTTSVR